MRNFRIVKRSLFVLPVLLIMLSCNQNKDKREAAKEYLKDQTVNYDESEVKEAVNDNGILILSDKSFDQVISKGVTLVDFWATWCKPCQLQAPVVEEISIEMKDQIKVGKMDVDMNKYVPQRFSIESIPTMILFKDGVAVERITGLTDKATLVNYINKHI